jgi:hypothetical protein
LIEIGSLATNATHKQDNHAIYIALVKKTKTLTKKLSESRSVTPWNQTYSPKLF